MPTDFHWKAKLIFIAALCAGGIAAGLWFFQSSGRYITYRIETHDPVSGLIADSPVEMHGVEVGKVSKVELVDPGTVSILLRLAKTTPVSKATVATITARGLAARGFTGYVYVALENTGADTGPLMTGPGQLYPAISTAPSLTNTMDTTVADATQKIRLLTRLLQSVLDEKTIASLKRSMDRLEETMATLKANNERLASLIDNAERASRDISLLLDEKTIVSLKQSAELLQKNMAMLTANDERLASLIVNAERDSRDIGPLLDTSSTTLTELRQMLPKFYQAIADLDGLTHSLNGVAGRITRDPSTVIRGSATPPGPGER